MKHDNKNSTLQSTLQHDTQNEPPQLQQDNISQKTRNFVAISNCLPNFGKGLCWTFVSILILTIVVFVLMGDIGPNDLMSAAHDYLTK